MYVHITYNTKTCTYMIHTCTYKYEPVYTCIYNVCTYNEACTYLTISAQDMLILTTKAVDHINNMGNTGMVEPEPAFLSPRVRLSKSGTLAHTGHHAQHPPGASLARHN